MKSAILEAIRDLQALGEVVQEEYPAVGHTTTTVSTFKEFELEQPQVFSFGIKLRAQVMRRLADVGRLKLTFDNGGWNVRGNWIRG